MKLEVFTVTGSNIKRLEVERVLPVTVLAPESIAIRDGAQPSDLLTALSQVTDLPGNESAALGATADARGYEPSFHNVMARGRTYSLQFTK